MIAARNNDVPLIEQAPKAAVTHSIASLAESLSSDQKAGEEIGAGGKKSGLGRLLPFWKGGK